MISIEIIVQAELDKIKAQLPGRTAQYQVHCEILFLM